MAVEFLLFVRRIVAALEIDSSLLPCCQLLLERHPVLRLGVLLDLESSIFELERMR